MNGTIRRRVLARGAALLTGGGGLFAAACSQGGQPAAPAAVAQKPATLQLVLNAANLVEQWADGFKAVSTEYPAIKIEPIVAQGPGGWGGYFEKVTAMVTAGTPPDIIRIATEGFRLMAHHGMLLSMDPLIKRDGNSEPLKGFVADVNKDAWRLTGYNGKQYAMPHSMNCPVMHYNTAFFAQAGIARPADTWTLDDFERIAKQLSRPDQDQWGFRTTNALWGGVCPFLAINGADLVTDDLKQSRANDPKTVEAVERYASYGTRLHYAPPNGAAADDAWNAGKLAMRLDGGGAPATYARAGMKDYDILPVPKWKAQTHLVGMGSMGLAKDGKQPESAWHVLKFIGRPEIITKFIPGTVPSLRSVRYKLPIPESGPPKNFKLYSDVQNYGLREVASPPEYTELEPMVLKHLGEAIKGEASAKSAMDNLHRELTDLLSRRTPPVA